MKISDIGIKILAICSFISMLSGIRAQTVSFKSIDDSTTIRVIINIFQDEKRITEIKSKDGLVDFSSIQNGQLVEVLAEGYEEKSFIKNGAIPQTIYLQRIATRFDEMVVTGQMQQTTISDAVQNVRIITSKKIEQMGAQNLTQLFKNELNIQLSSDAILGSGMSLQGISGENVKLLIDGVPVIGRLNGTVDLDQINIQNVERIEIIEGPLSVNYGSDALAGTINIITKKNGTYLLSGKGYVYYESNGTYNTQLSLSSKFNKTTISADVNRNYFDGWRSDEKPFYIEKVREADTFRNKFYKPREQFFGGMKINHRLNSSKLNDGLFLTGDFRVFQEEIENRGTPMKPYFIKAFDDFYNTFRSDNSLSLVGRIAKKWTINSTNAYNYFQRIKNTYANDLTTLEKTLAGATEQDTSKFDLFLSRTSFIWNQSKIWSLEVGYDVNYESSRGKRITGEKVAIGDYAIFATSEIDLWRKLTIKPGLRASYNSVYNSPVIPSIFFKYKVTKNNDIRFSYSRGFRAPSLKELYFYFVDINHNIQGNIDLKAETSDNYQLSLRTEYEKGKCRLVLNNQLFFNDLRNLITLVQVTNTEYSYANLNRAQTYGFTFNANFIRKSFSVDAGLSIKGRKTQVYDNEDPRPTAFYPEVKVNPTYTFTKINTSLSLFYKFTGKLPNFMVQDDGSVVETKRDVYHMLDFTASSYFWKRKIGVTLGIKNILDVTSINGLSGSDGAHSSGSTSVQIGMGRTYFCSLIINLNTKK
ncbi:MAG TPA: TonB-dependent receptor [Taishania sp.]|nr:TonB-dependent receptor [Taishania sp.]